MESTTLVNSLGIGGAIFVGLPAQMETSEGQIEVQLKDISLGGAFVVCQNPLPLNEQFSLIINASSQGPFALNSEVVWSNINVPEDKVINRGMGIRFMIRFIKNTDADRQRLNQVIMEHLEETID
jgi:hypothetical protein